MANLLIEYRVDDFAAWKAVFDRDPMGREAHGATGHRIYRDPADPNHLILSLGFPSTDRAKALREALRPVWDVSGAGQAWILKETEVATS